MDLTGTRWPPFGHFEIAFQGSPSLIPIYGVSAYPDFFSVPRYFYILKLLKDARTTLVIVSLIFSSCSSLQIERGNAKEVILTCIWLCGRFVMDGQRSLTTKNWWIALGLGPI